MDDLLSTSWIAPLSILFSRAHPYNIARIRKLLFARDEARQNVVDALELHIEGLIEDGLPIPTPKSEADYVVAES